MKTNTVSLVLGFAFLSLAAVACADSDSNEGGATNAPSAVMNEATSSSSSSGSAIEPSQGVKTPSVPVDGPIDTAIGVEPDAGWKPDPTQAEEPMPEEPAPAADAGSPPVKTPIPIPKFGSLHAVSNVGDNCAFTIDGKDKGAGLSLDTNLVVGVHGVSCLRDDGTSASSLVEIEAGKKAEVVIEFEQAHLSLVAVGGVCNFSVDGQVKGSGVNVTLDILPGKHVVDCHQTNGGVQTHIETLKPGATTLSTFFITK